MKLFVVVLGVFGLLAGCGNTAAPEVKVAKHIGVDFQNTSFPFYNHFYAVGLHDPNDIDPYVAMGEYRMRGRPPFPESGIFHTPLYKGESLNGERYYGENGYVVSLIISSTSLQAGPPGQSALKGVYLSNRPVTTTEQFTTVRITDFTRIIPPVIP
ncbi:MAG: hypothetical protein LBD09_06170 [Treponema sp.]|jgi:hypothetical protein|nr:hypothetical protein [Treponema sp.]